MSPINRAAEKCKWLMASDLDKYESRHQMHAHTVFESIDPSALADVLARHSYEVAYGGCPCGADFEGEATLEEERSAYNLHLAQAVKDYLTGSDKAETPHQL